MLDHFPAIENYNVQINLHWCSTVSRAEILPHQKSSVNVLVIPRDNTICKFYQEIAERFRSSVLLFATKYLYLLKHRRQLSKLRSVSHALLLSQRNTAFSAAYSNPSAGEFHNQLRSSRMRFANDWYAHYKEETLGERMHAFNGQPTLLSGYYSIKKIMALIFLADTDKFSKHWLESRELCGWHSHYGRSPFWYSRRLTKYTFLIH